MNTYNCYDCKSWHDADQMVYYPDEGLYRCFEDAYKHERVELTSLRTRLAAAEMALAGLCDAYRSDGSTKRQQAAWHAEARAALLAQPAVASETGSEEADRLCVNCGEPMKNHVGGAKRGLCKNGEWNSWGNSDATQPA